MTTTISAVHQQRFEEIKKSLHALGCKESTFLKVELLFFEVLSISRAYGNDPQENSLLAALKEVQFDQYEKTKEITRRQGQRELRIRQFVVKLKKVLSGR